MSLDASKAGVVRTGIIALVATLIAFVGFGGALLDLVTRWVAQDEYSHGFLIPLVSAWLLWTRREALRTSIGRPAWTGPLIMLLAAAMLLVGELSATFILSQVGFVLALFGLVLGLGGYPLFRKTFIPIAFLLFAIPMPAFVDSMMSLRLQLISSELGVFFVRMLQIPVYLEGNIIDLGQYKVQVVEACSGLRYLYPLLSLSFLAAYFFKAPLWQRAAVFFSSIPITIVMNSLKIGIVSATVDYWGTQAADGFLHFFEGWIIFVACAGILALEMYCLALIAGKSLVEVFSLPSPAAEPTGFVEPRLAGQIPLVASVALLCAAVVAVFFVSGRSEIIPERSRFAAFPERIGPWQGHPSPLDPRVERKLAVDDYILSDYQGPRGNTVNLYVAYYASQRQGESPHSPVVCLPGGGWQIARLERTSYTSNGVKMPVNRAIIERNSIKQVVYYWFDERGRQVANEYLAKWYLLTDAIVMNRSDAALIRLTTEVDTGETERDADERLRAFMQDAVPRLSEYLPSGGRYRTTSVLPGPNGHAS